MVGSACSTIPAFAADADDPMLAAAESRSTAALHPAPSSRSQISKPAAVYFLQVTNTAFQVGSMTEAHQLLSTFHDAAQRSSFRQTTWL